MKQNQKNNLFWTFSLSFMLLGAAFGAKAGEIEKNIIMQANQERANAGLAELRENDILNIAADMKANDMIANDYFAHTSPQGVDPWHWIQEAGYHYKYAGENLAMNFSSALSAHRAWMKSESHKENILSDRYTEVGVAVLEGNIGGKQTKIAVQFFGAPLGGAGNSLVMQQEKKGLEESENQIQENFAESSIEIQEASIKPWETRDGKEMIVYAKVAGSPQAVEAHFGGSVYGLPNVGQDRYMNLVRVEDFDFEKQSVVIKAEMEEGQAMFYQLPADQYLSSVKGVETVSEVSDNKKSKLAAAQFEKAKVANSHNTALFLFAAACLIIICNIWILEKEEERLLLTCNQK